MLFSSLLSVFPFMKFFRSPLGKLALAIGIVLMGIASFQFWLYGHDKRLRDTLTAEYNVTQAAFSEQQQLLFDQRMSAALQKQALVIKRVIEQRDARDAETEVLLRRLDGLGGGDASEVLRRAVELIGG